MTIQIVVLELALNEDHTHNQYIRFDLDDGKDFCYRSRVSHGAFFHSAKQRNRNKKFLYTSKHDNEHQISIDHWREMMNKYPNLTDIYASVPIVHVKNLWEFYKLIGYDYKSKKWLGTVNT